MQCNPASPADGEATTARDGLLALSARASADAALAAMGVMALSDSMSVIAGKVQDQAALSRELSESSTRCVETVASLTSRTDQIGDLAAMINDIANSAAMLSINATIEAARCGEAGKTFAVVAREFKALAAQTQDAAVKIAAILDAVREDTNGATTATGAMSQTIGKMNAATESIRSAVIDQRTGTQTIIMQAEETAEDISALNDALSKIDGSAFPDIPLVRDSGSI